MKNKCNGHNGEVRIPCDDCATPKEITGWDELDDLLSGWIGENKIEEVKIVVQSQIASAVEARDDYWMNQKANEHDNAIREAERKRISEAVKEMKSSVEKAGIKKQWEVTDEDRSSGSYNYIESGFLGGYQTAKQDILSIINPSKE